MNIHKVIGKQTKRVRYIQGCCTNSNCCDIYFVWTCTCQNSHTDTSKTFNDPSAS